MSARESIIPVFVPHLGCPNDCVFCNQRRISGQQKCADADSVRQAVQEANRLLPKGTRRQLYCDRRFRADGASDGGKGVS